jgi:hypothetical protein
MDGKHSDVKKTKRKLGAAVMPPAAAAAAATASAGDGDDVPHGNGRPLRLKTSDCDVKKPKLTLVEMLQDPRSRHENLINYIRSHIELAHKHFPKRTIYIDTWNLDVAPIELMTENSDPNRHTFLSELLEFCAREKLSVEIIREGNLVTDDVDLRFDYREFEHWDESEKVEFVKKAKMIERPVRLKFTPALPK